LFVGGPICGGGGFGVAMQTPFVAVGLQLYVKFGLLPNSAAQSRARYVQQPVVFGSRTSSWHGSAGGAQTVAVYTQPFPI